MILRLKEAIRWRIIWLNVNCIQPFFVKMGIKKYKPKLKQEAMFIEALEEQGVEVKLNKLRIDHETPNCFYGEEKYNVIFPKRYINKIENLPNQKRFDYYFRGLHTDKRDWVLKFDNIGNSKVEFTEQGRRIAKDHFDSEYYFDMCSSKFVLCPPGKFLWTYRFYESIMCKSIPVIERDTFEPSMSGFKFYYSDDSLHEFKTDWIEHNYFLFLKRHTLIS